MIHPVRKTYLLLFFILSFVLTGTVVHALGLVLGYGGAVGTNGPGVFPQTASANSERYFRVIVTYNPSSETLTNVSISGSIGLGTTRLGPYRPGVDPNDGSDFIARNEGYTGSTSTNRINIYTIGPFAGPHPYTGQTRPNTIGRLSGWEGVNDWPFTFSATSVSGTTTNTASVTGTYRQQEDCAERLEWWVGDAANLDPLSVDGPTPGSDNGSSSNTYTFRVQYKIPNNYGLNLLPRWGNYSGVPGPVASYVDMDTGVPNVRGDNTTDHWIYHPGYGPLSGIWPSGYSQLNPLTDTYQDLCGYWGNTSEPEAVLIIDKDYTHPRFMVREDPADSNARDANGVRYFYKLMPTDFADFIDTLFQFPQDPPGPDPIDSYLTGIRGRNVSNNYVALQAGGHTYEFLASDDFSPANMNRAWCQVGRPGNQSIEAYLRPRLGGAGVLEPLENQSANGVYRFDDKTGGYGYPFDSQDATQYPQCNPMLTAHPYFPSGSILPYQSEGQLDVNPTDAGGTETASPFAPEVGYGPNPPLRVTNDDTILPNYVNIQQDTAQYPFRGGKWTSANQFTFRINYWQSNNRPPEYIRVWIRKTNNPTGWRAYTMEKANAADNVYTDGCVYQYVASPSQLPDAGGPGDYNYYFVASDGIRQATFPNRPALGTDTGGAYSDPADIGVEPGTDGSNDYYAFRVNRLPALSEQSVTQSIGSAGDDFLFRVKYTDTDGQMLAATPQGDRPFESSIWIDLFGNPQGEGRVAQATETSCTYTMTEGPGYAAGTLNGKTLEMISGPAAGKTYTIASNTTTTITLVAGSRLVSDGVVATNRFRISEWFHGTMIPEDVTDTNYADGKYYKFNSATHVVFGEGVHRYYFEFVDDWGSWLYPNDNNVRVEGEKVRFPFTGTFEGPEVRANTAPVLTNYRFTPDALTGADGTTATPFIFSVTYRDAENNAPAYVRLGIDEDPSDPTQPALIVEMAPDNPLDKVYTDGAIYKSTPVKLAEGPHTFRAQASDSSGRYPSTGSWAGPLSNPNDWTSAPLPNAPGPQVSANTPPSLSFPSTDNNTTDPNNPPGLEPNSGRKTTPFVYTVIYTDTDRFAGVAGNPPDATTGGYVRVFIDDVQYDMTKVDATDNDYTNGVTYEFNTATAGLQLEQAKPHTYYFVASDGLDRARKPGRTAVPNYYNGPVVDEPPGPPYSLMAADHKGVDDTGRIIDLTFNASDDDGSGADDVTEYRLYRTQTPGTYTGPAVATIAANNAATYTLQDRNAQTGVTYYYVVKAWDGFLESDPSAPEAGPVSASDDFPPNPPTNVTVNDPGLGGTLNISWNLSSDDGSGWNDVIEYHIYRANTATGFAGAPLATVGKGINTYSDTTCAATETYYYKVLAFDGSHESADSNIAGPFTPTDRQAPIIADLSPANRELNVPVDTQISFTVSDNGTGVDRDTLQTAATVSGVPVDLGTPTITGSPSQYTVLYTPVSPFAFRSVVTVTVSVSDLGGKSASKTWKFTIAGPTTYSISGTITNVGGTPKQGVVVSSGDLSDTTDAAGNYSITGLVQGSYIVTPTLKNFAFSPEQQTVQVDADVTGINFTWADGFDITGRVVDEAGVGMQGVSMSDGSHTVITDADGRWAFYDLPAGTYNVTPTFSQHVFEPSTQQVVIGPNASGIRFVGRLEAWAISGTITDILGNRLEAVAVEATGNGQTFDAVTNASGDYQIPDLRPGRYVVTPRKAEYQFQPLNQTVDVDADVTEVSFVGMPIYSLRLPSGLSFIAIPVIAQDSSPVAVFGATTDVLRYDPTGANTISGNPDYVRAANDPTLEIIQVRPGRGFWARLANATTIRVPGTPISNSQTTAFQLSAGWNMVGNPYNTALPWANVGVTSGGPVRDFAYIYDRASGNYHLVSDVPGLGGLTSIPANAGMWMRALGAQAVTISPVSGTSASRHSAWTRSAGEFVIPVHATAGNRADTSARAGVVQYAASHPRAYLVDNPPMFTNGVDVYFTGENGRMLTCDIRGESAAKLTYDFAVRTDLKNTPVKVSLPDLSQVPREKAVILTDLQSGKRQWARTANTFTYNSGSGGERKFRLEITSDNGGGLAVSLMPASAKSGGASISYTLSKAAQVEITVMNVSGRTVRVLAADRSAQPGLNTEAWDLRNATGSKVPPGRYLVRLQAVADDGQKVSAVAPLTVQ